MRSMSKRQGGPKLTLPEILVDPPTAQQLRASLSHEVPAGLEPVSKLVRAMEASEREGRRTMFISYWPGSSDKQAGTLIDELLPDDPPAVPSSDALLQARSNAQARIELLREFGYRTAEQIAEGRSRAANRHALAGRWRKEGRVFAVDWKGRSLYPLFQFDGDGDPRPIVREVLRVLPTDKMSEWEVALWWTAANGWLSSRRPVDLLDSPNEQQLTSAAERLSQPSPL